MNANRRLQERKLPERIVLCKLGGEESSFVLNLSEDGLGFESHTRIEKTGVLQLRLSAEMDGTIETTGRLAWMDPEKRTGGLRFLELSASAREKIRAWLRETSIPSSATNDGALLAKPVKQAVERALPDKQPLDSPLTYNSAPDKRATCRPVPWQQAPAPSMQLVPIERHRAQKRRHFLGGVFVGFGTCAVLVIAISWFAGGMKSVSLPWITWTTASVNPAVPSIVQQTRASTIQPASPGAPISKPAATKPLATEPEPMQAASLAPPTRSPQNQRQTQSQKQSPPSAGASSTNLSTRTPSPSTTSQPAKPTERGANSRPSAKSQPLEASQAPSAPAPAALKSISSSDQAQHPKKAPPTPQQLWSALQKGNVKAAVALADLYARGDGVPQNCQQARVFLQVASEKKNAEATKKLQELDKNGCPADTATQ